jgi:hypothetical protein
MRERFLLCGVALATLFLAIHVCGLENFPIKAAPPTCLAISDRIFFLCVPLTALLLAFNLGHLDHFPVEATPTLLWAILPR